MLRRLTSFALGGVAVLVLGALGSLFGVLTIDFFFSPALAGSEHPNSDSVDELGCAHHYPAYFVVDGHRIEIRETLAGAKTMDPIYHDCQRLLARRNKQGIIGADPKNKLAYQGRAAVYSTTDILLTLPDSLGAYRQQGLVVATVFSEDVLPEAGVPYKITCIAIRQAEEGGAYTAFAVKGSKDGKFCDLRYSPDNSAELAIQRTLFESPNGKKLDQAKFFPTVARWEWNSASGTQMLGVPCGLAWCRIAGTGVPIPVLPSWGEQNANETSDFVNWIPGWSDEQYLAKKEKGANSDDVKPSELYGKFTVTAGVALNAIGPDAYQGAWIDVATATVSGREGEGPYDKKFGLKKGSGSIRFSLCQGDAQRCSVPQEAVEGANCAAKSNAWKTDPWYAKVSRTDQKPQYLCAIGYKSAEEPASGGLVWRWVKGDEGMWIRCPKGCCELT
ncbi:MAG: hypothetical protein ACKVZ0_06265 [Gemmatimonadales bacterium]